MVGFLIGSGLMMLGAFFLWRLVGAKAWGAVCGVLVPSGTVILLTGISGATEVAVGLLWGVVAINFAVIGLVNLIFQTRVSRSKSLLTLLWVGLSLSACFVAGRNVKIGMFSGWGLVTVGLIAVWQMLNAQAGKQQPQAVDAEAQVKPVDCEKRVAKVWWWMWLVSALVAIVFGAWLMVWRHGVVAAECKMSDSQLGAVVLAPLCGVATLFGLRSRGQWQVQNLLAGLTRANVVLSTVGLGLVTVLGGGLHLTQSTLLITLPWVAGLTVLFTVVAHLPQKTARWWGGLMIAMYFGYVISLLW